MLYQQKFKAYGKNDNGDNDNGLVRFPRLRWKNAKVGIKNLAESLSFESRKKTNSFDALPILAYTN